MMIRSKSRLAALALTLVLASQAHAAPIKTVSLALTGEPPQLNSTKATDAQSFMILGHMMEGLLRNGRSAGEYAPGVAEKWTVTDRGATFTLRKNAKWADGKPVTAHDFVFSWRLVVDPKNASEYAFIMYPVKNAEKIAQNKAPVTELGVKAEGDHTLKVEFEKPCGYFLGLTAFSTYYPVREDFYNQRKDKYGADAKDLLANGAYTMSEWVHGSKLTLNKNPNYWNAASIKIDRIAIPYMTPDNMAQFNFFKDKKTDLIERLGKDELPRAQAEKFKLHSYNDGSVWYMEFNFRDGRVTRNKNLRKAIQLVLAANMTEYVNKIIGIPGTKPGATLVPSWVRGAKDLFRKEYPYTAPKGSIAEAKKHIELAKKELGGSIPALIWLTGDTPFAGREAEYFQNLLGKHLGLTLKIDKQIFKQRLAKMTSGEFDIVAAGWGPDFADPMTFAELKASWNENNRGQWKNADYDKAIREAQSTADQKKRMAAMAKAERIMLDDIAVVPTYERTVIYLMSDRVQNLKRNPIGPDPDFTYASVKE